MLGWSFKGFEEQKKISLHKYGPMLKIHWAFFALLCADEMWKCQKRIYLLSVGQFNFLSPCPGTLVKKDFGLLTYSLKHKVKAKKTENNIK